jgi:phosphohistidine phosphatase
VRTLYLLRHAKSSWDDQTLTDHERPLAPRGIRDAKRMAAHLGSLADEPELVLCSSAVRARETLDLVKPAFGDATVMFEDGLYGASAESLLERIRGVPESVRSVLAIGHNPGLADLALGLASGGDLLDELRVKFPTCAFATLDLGSGNWADARDGDATLTGFVTPKTLH